MLSSRYSHRSSSASSADSNHQSPRNRLKSPAPSDYQYLGRLVTRERPINRKPKSVQQNYIFPRNTQKYQHSMKSHHHQNIYQDMSVESSDDDDIDNSDGLSKPMGVIRISDRHFREIYRLPTPPPTVKRVYHRLRSPEPKVIERVYVRRAPPQVIENIIEVPPEKIRIIKREKYLDQTKPITRSKLVHLKSRHRHREEEEEEEEQQQQQETFIPPEQYSQQQTYIPSKQYSQQQATTPLFTASEQAATTLVYPPQPNMPTVGYIKSTIPPHIMFKSQQPLQLPAQQVSNQPMIQPTPYTYPPQQSTNYQMVQPTPYIYPSQQPVNYQMVQPTPYTYPSQQPGSYQMVQPTPYTYPPQ